jgi:predicted Zn-dependent protease
MRVRIILGNKFHELGKLFDLEHIPNFNVLMIQGNNDIRKWNRLEILKDIIMQFT